MIAAWMLYATAAAVLVGLAAAGADRALRLLGRPTRWAWAVALAVSVLFPVAAWRLAVSDAAGPVEPAMAPAAGAPAAGAASGAGPSLDELLARATVVEVPTAALARFDRPLVVAWLALSLALAAWFLLAHRRLRRARREWRPAVVEQAPVLVSGRTGPAVAGVLRAAVVLPEWALAADRSLLQLMLAHEQEHVRAGDPRLLAGAAAAVALMPWNPALWWQLHRLRLAVEIDCDRRVLRRYPDVRRYGALLLEVGRLAAPAERLPLAAFTAPGSSLERRIRSMTMTRPRHPLLQGTALAAAAALLVLVACEMPHPTAVAPTPDGAVPLERITRSSAELQPQETVTPERIRAVVERTMPGLLREATGRPVTLWIVADAGGSVQHVEHRRIGGRYVFEAFTAEGLDPKTGETRFTARRIEAADSAARLTAGLDPDAIASIEVLKLAPGRVTADSAGVIWVQLKPGARMSDARNGRVLLRAGPAAAQEPVAVRGRRSTTYSRDSVAGRVTLRRGAATIDTVRLAPSAPADTARAASDPTARTRSLPPAGGERTIGGILPQGRVTLAPAGTGNAIYVIDGERLSDGDARLKSLDPKEIDSIEVLKGAAAASLYGEAAKDGVIRITTKAGAAAQPGAKARTLPPR